MSFEELLEEIFTDDQDLNEKKVALFCEKIFRKEL